MWAIGKRAFKIDKIRLLIIHNWPQPCKMILGKINMIPHEAQTSTGFMRDLVDYLGLVVELFFGGLGSMGLSMCAKK